MRLYVNLDTLQLVSGPGIGKIVSQFEFKRGDAAELRVQFLDGGLTPVKLPAGTSLVFVVKTAGNFDGAALVIDNTWTTPTGDDFDYRVYPNFNTTELNTALGVGAASDLALVSASGEISWQVGAGAPTTTKTFAVLVHNDLYRGNESDPALAALGYPLPSALVTTSDIGVNVAAKAHSHLAAELPATMPPSAHNQGITTITGIITATATLTWAEIAAGAEATLTAAVAGALVASNPSVALGWASALEAGVVLKQARISANDVASITLLNETTGAITPAATTVRVTIFQF